VAENPDLRASDADREHTVEVLQEGFAQGRLTADEFQERMDAAYAAKTLAQLAPLTADLPPAGRSGRPGAGVAPSGAIDPAAEWRPVANPHGAVQHNFTRQLQVIWGGWVSMTLVLTTIWVLAGHSGDFWPLWPIGVYGAACLARTITGGGRDHK
jgi:Domain of unknown function (DUF1707)